VEALDDLHHVAVTVSNRDRSAAWYTEVLGLVEDFSEDTPTRRAAVLRFPGGGFSVAVVEHVGATSGAFDPTVTGLDHLAFSVGSQDEMRRWAARLDEHGIAHSGPITVPPGEILNFKDPDGIALALFWDKPR
jgi:glyoxylase I family protein